MVSKKLWVWILVSLLIAGVNAQQNTTASYGDYTLYSPQNGTKAYLIDLAGNTYHTWTFASTAKTGYSTYMMPGGSLVRSVAHSGNSLNGGGMTGEIQKVDYSGTVTWDYVYSSTTYCLHHDHCPLPNGNVLMISYEVKTAANATQAGCSSAIAIWSEKIIEVQPTGATTGTIVWEWHVWDHLCQNYSSLKDNYVTSIVQHPELLNINYQTAQDWIHMNGIDYNPGLDQIAISSHTLNEIYVIDHSTTTAQAATHTGGNSGKGGDFLYRWGNPAAYGATGTTNFNVVHDAHFIPAGCPKAGYLAGFNNKGGTGTKSCIDVINPPHNGYNYNITLGSAFLPATYTWRTTYSGNATQDMGNSQQLPNGNTLICIAMSGYLYEIDSNQTVVWSKTIGGTIPQAFRYTACYLNGTVAATASATTNAICLGDSVQLNVTATGSTSYTYNWASTPTGFSSTVQAPWVTPAATAAYTVTVTASSCTGTSTVTVMVNPLPTAPTITQTGTALSSSTGTTYQWYYNGNIINGATNQNYSPIQNGNYQVMITDQNGCHSPLSATFNYLGTGIDENAANTKISLYPNPSAGIIHINRPNCMTGDLEISVYDVYGQVVLKAVNAEYIDLTQSNNGLYYIVGRAGNSTFLNEKIFLIK